MITLAYISEWKFKGLPERDAARLTHANYSFAKVKDGRASAAHWEDDARARELIARYPGLKVGISLGGWGADGFSQAMVSGETRALLAETLVKLTEDYGFHGVDLDWEYPCDGAAGISSDPADRERYPLFIRLLRQKLDELGEKTGRYYFLTMAVGAAEKYAKNLDFPKMMDCIDFVNLMTYDMDGWDGFSGHHAALYPSGDPVHSTLGASLSAEIYQKYGVPKEKLVIGASFYGRSWRMAERGERDGLFMPQVPGSAAPVGYDVILRRAEAGAKVIWDETACAPYLYDPSDGFFVSYDDERSVQLKKRFARDNGLGGVMFWEYNEDPSGKLLDAIDRA